MCARSRQARRRRSTRSLGAYRGDGEAGVREGEREGEGGFVWVGDALQRLRATARWSRRAAPFGQRPTAARWEKAAPRPACGAAEGPRRARPPSARSPQPTRRRPRPISNNLARSRAHLGRSRWVDPKDGGRERVRSRPISREAQGHLSREELTAPRHCARAARPRGNSSAGSRRCGAAGRASGGRGAAPPPTREMPTRRTHPHARLSLSPRCVPTCSGACSRRHHERCCSTGSRRQTTSTGRGVTAATSRGAQGDERYEAQPSKTKSRRPRSQRCSHRHTRRGNASG